VSSLTTTPVVDLRSDTVTRPSAAMRAAMAEAEVGDDVYGEDPTVAELEARIATMLGHEAAMFTPTGSMANQIGLRLLVPAGAELLCDVQAHVARNELGAAAVFSGITSRTWSAPRGRLDADQVAAIMTPDAGPLGVSTAAVTVENTHNFGGGSVQPLAELERLRALTEPVGVAMHLDGARLWNAHVATGVPLNAYGRLFDTVSVCLSKGLGAPVGSLLASTAERIAAARIWRKRWGGGMRQVGVLAAAGRYALDHNVARLAEDHARARRLAEVVAAAAPHIVEPSTVETNIVTLDLRGAGLSAADLVGQARERGVLVGALGPYLVRLVTHLDLDDAMAERAGDVLADLLGGRRVEPVG
jgi:threonine aldolase